MQASQELALGILMPRMGLGVFDMDNETTASIVCAAIELGYRSIDTASIYGNEVGVGEGIRRSGIDRGDLFVTTKLWVDAHGVQPAQRAAEASLARLGLDYLDLYLIHWPYSVGGQHRQAWLGLETVKERGLTRQIGVSNFSPTQLNELVELGGSIPVINQIELHPFNTRGDDRANHTRLGVVTESWSPLARGRIFDNPVIAAVAAKHGVSAARAVLRWHLQHGLVTVAKSSSPARLAENLAVFDFVLDDDDMAGLNGLDRGESIEPDYYKLS
ncbi:diketogulonate reductase-like aldo/keto reductase [Glaciihabitans tibetensis]|uniref:Diketogulonate reductase-like aldo/keto reductase n=2 Tax=Glaciihabitans tibetensis TaxID=1266600 RepID=A0A2T0VAU2_9MICO|nr:diketogulonate reductase-like aldo/keto reductase [Glaciihabitans tibetensis]